MPSPAFSQQQELAFPNYYNVYQYFHFYPSKGIIVVAFALFSLASLLILLSTMYTRRWYMLIAFGVGVAELVGFAFRWEMLRSPAYGSYVAMQCLLIIPPSFLALVEYITLGKVVKLVRARNPDVKDFLKPQLIQWLYFACEIGSLALQGGGAGLSVSVKGYHNPHLQAGKILLILGLAFLVVIICVFLMNAAYVCYRRDYGVRQSRELILLFVVLYCSSILLLIRNIFRLVEFADGFYGYISVREKYFYGLDSLMVVMILFIFGIFNYGFFLEAYEKKSMVKPDVPNQTEMI